jgi:hypothetical protein
VARVCLAIAENPEDARRLTIKRNTVAVVTDGSAVLGLGNIGPAAAMTPVVSIATGAWARTVMEYPGLGADITRPQSSTIRISTSVKRNFRTGWRRGQVSPA